MKWGDWNPAIAAGASILGDYLGSKEDAKVAAENRRSAEAMNAANVELQREFAQHGIRWRVEDAKAAGIHPLYAIGAQGASFSPSSVVAEVSSSRGDFLRRSGQNISRAVEMQMSQEERGFNHMRNALELERLGLENNLLRVQISNVGRASGPGFPNFSGISMTGQGDSGVRASGGPVELLPLGRTYSPKGQPSKAYGSVTDWTFSRTPTGMTVVPSPDIQGSLANNMLEMLKWEISHAARQTVDPRSYQPSLKEFPLPKGQYWKWHAFAREWRPANAEVVDPRSVGRYRR